MGLIRCGTDQQHTAAMLTQANNTVAVHSANRQNACTEQLTALQRCATVRTKNLTP